MANGFDADPSKFINPLLSGSKWDPTWTGTYDVFDEDQFDKGRLDAFWSDYGMYFDRYDADKEVLAQQNLENKTSSILFNQKE